MTGTHPRLGTCGPLPAKNIQAVDKAQHAITVHPVVLVHRTAVGCQRTGDVALLLQDVIHFKANRGIPLKECLGDLGVPYQLVAVHAAVAVTAASLVGNVGRERHVPRCHNGSESPV